jgi:hypothetical protein
MCDSWIVVFYDRLVGYFDVDVTTLRHLQKDVYYDH